MECSNGECGRADVPANTGPVGSRYVYLNFIIVYCWDCYLRIEEPFALGEVRWGHSDHPRLPCLLPWSQLCLDAFALECLGYPAWWEQPGPAPSCPYTLLYRATCRCCYS